VFAIFFLIDVMEERGREGNDWINLWRILVSVSRTCSTYVEVSSQNCGNRSFQCIRTLKKVERVELSTTGAVNWVAIWSDPGFALSKKFGNRNKMTS
jgi:hypothetical protein